MIVAGFIGNRDGTKKEEVSSRANSRWLNYLKEVKDGNQRRWKSRPGKTRGIS